MGERGGEMGSVKHTPGPWVVGVTVDRTHGDWPVFRLRGLEDPNPDGAEVQANANLIAAAPDLLAALEAMDRYFFIEDHTEDGDPEAYRALYEQARAALAKARGDAA